MTLDSSSLALFVVASLVVIVTPGQDMILVLSRSLTQGSWAGIATAAGVSLGLVGHSLLAAAGLGALLHTSDWLFFAIQLAGAAYLLYLSFQLLRAQAPICPSLDAPSRPLLRLFLEGALSNLSNPKIVLFYFAFLPQFVLPTAHRPALSVVTLGLVFAGLTFLVKGPIGFCAGRFSTWIQSRPNTLSWLSRASAAVLFGLALKLALERRP